MKKYIYLVKVEPNANNNKYYKMIELDDSTFEVQYGRIGNNNYQSKQYPEFKWDSILKSKLKKGYVDQTRLVATPIVKNKKKYLDIKNDSISSIVDRLRSMAKQAIKDNYTVSSTNVTQTMIDEAQNLLNKLNESENIDLFNQILIDLFKTIPRKMSKVSYYLADSKKQFGDILEREQDLLDVMRGQVVTENIENETDDKEIINQTILDAMGIEIKEITQDDEKLIKSHLGGIKDKYYKAWKVINKKTQKRFDEFIKDNKIDNVKLLWHGTRSENVWSILSTGLVLRPQAKITGKLYGHGIYFAPKARKSLGYTSLDGSYWVKGNGNCGFMILNDVAYGIPYDVYDFNSKYYDLNYDNLQKFKKDSNCLHAHAGAKLTYSSLKNDEIIVYKEEQVTCKYLVELRN